MATQKHAQTADRQPETVASKRLHVDQRASQISNCEYNSTP